MPTQISHAAQDRRLAPDKLPPVEQEIAYLPAPATADDGDGLLLAVIWRSTKARSEQVIADAQNVTRRPVPSVALPHRAAWVFHSSFVAHPH